MTKVAGIRNYKLRLYIAGPGSYANLAKQNLANAAAAGKFDYELEIVDLLSEPLRAVKDHIVVTPTLIKLSPSPRTMVVGDLSNIETIIMALR